jgi:hypothetical protein
MGLPKTYKSASIFSRGSAYDVQKPTTDHDPTANLLNYDDIDATTGTNGTRTAPTATWAVTAPATLRGPRSAAAS